MHLLKPKSLAGWMIALPMVLAVLYYSLFAADRYVSESIISVRDAGQASNPASGLAMLVGLHAPASQDVLYLKEYIHSLDMLLHLEKKLGLRRAYAEAGLDPFYRLFPNVSQEWFLRYYRNRVDIRFDDAASLITLRIDGFSPAFVRALNAEILNKSESFINEVSHRMAREQMTFAEGELQKARERFQQAKSQLLQFQNKHRLLDPAAQAQATIGLSTQLEAELAKQETELKNLRSYLQEDAHQVVAQSNQIAALKAQLEQERGRVTGASDGRLNTLAAQYQSLLLDAGFAEDAYKLALSATEAARIEASRKLKGVVVVESPTLPEASLYPQRIYNLVTLLLALTLFYGVTRLAIATLRDHQE